MKKTLSAIKLIIKTDKNSLKQEDIFGTIPLDILKFKLKTPVDTKNLQIKNSDLLKDSGLDKSKHYSLKELFNNKAIREFLFDKNIKEVNFKNLIKISTLFDAKSKENYFCNNKPLNEIASKIISNLYYDNNIKLGELTKFAYGGLYSTYIENKKDDKIGKYRDHQKKETAKEKIIYPFENYFNENFEEFSVDVVGKQ